MFHALLSRVSAKFKSDDLGSRCMRGGAILTAAVGLERMMRLVRSIILAKLISSADIGLVTLVAVVLTVFETAGEAGIRLSVIQNKRGDTPSFLNAAWWFQSIRGLVLTAAGILCAGWIAGWMQKPQLTPLLQAAFLAVAFNALVSPAAFLLEKHLRFGKYVLLNQGTMLLGTILTIGLAVWIRNAWPMIIGIAAEGVIRLGLSFVMCPFKPFFPIDREALRELFHFARGLAGMPLLVLGALYADVLIAGRMLTAEQVGYYGMAALLARIPRDLAMQIAGKLLLPAFAAQQDNPDALGRTLILASRWMTLAAAPLAAFFILWSKPILTVAFQPEYTAAAVAFAILAGVVFLRVHGVILWNYYIATAQLKQNRLFTLVRFGLLAVLIYPMVREYGMAGAAGAVLCGELAGFTLQTALLVRRVPQAGIGYLAGLLPGLGLGGALAAAGALLLKTTQLNIVSQLFVGAAMLSGVYVLAAIWEFSVRRIGKS
ncbi:MAG: oligosaccharide flippase family protein [Anaerohalosphaeraceae bacterium]